MSHRLTRSLTFAMTLLVLVPSLRADEKPAVKKEAAKFQPLDIRGQLADTDPVDPDVEGPYRLHSVALKKDKTYQIDLISAEFNAYLRLEGSTGASLAVDDNGGGMLNARIIYTPKDDGTFRIAAISLDQRVGQYQLKVAERKPPPPLAMKALDLGPKGIKHEDKLTANDPPDRVQMGCCCKGYTLKLKAGKTYRIDMTSADLDSYLRLEDAKGKVLDQDDDGGGNLDAQIVFNCTEDGIYHIIATTFVEGIGDFTLEVRE